MATEDLIIRLRADNEDLKRKLNQSGKDVKGFGDSLKNIGGIATIGFAAAGAAVIAFGKQSYKAFEEQEKANRRLLFSLQGNKAAFDVLTNQANKFQSTTGIADDKIMQIQTLGAQAGKSTAEIKKITEATINWASVTGQDLQAAYMQINGTLTGTAGRLTRVDADFEKLSETQLRNGGAIDLINQKYAGFAENSASALDKLSANWDEFTESVGSGIADIINPALESMNNAMTTIQNRSGGFWNKVGSALMLVSNNYAISSMATSISQADATIAQNEAEKELEKTGEKRRKQIIETTKATKSQTEAVDEWVKAHEKMRYLQQFNIPQFTTGGDLMGGADVGSKAGKGIPTKSANKEFLAGLKERHDAYIEELKFETTEAMNAADELARIDQQRTDNKLSILSGALGQIAGVFEEETTAYKVFASAQAAMDTYAGATAAYRSLAGIPIVGPALAFTAAGLITAAGLANIGKINGAFANGGIVGGNSFSGDQITARVNSGEMILNASQQAELFAIANGGGGGGQLLTKISANDIYLIYERGKYLSSRNGRR